MSNDHCDAGSMTARYFTLRPPFVDAINHAVPSNTSFGFTTGACLATHTFVRTVDTAGAAVEDVADDVAHCPKGFGFALAIVDAIFLGAALCCPTLLDAESVPKCNMV